MNRLLHDLYYRYKKPVWMIVIFFLFIFLLIKGSVLFLIYKGSRQQAEIERRRLSGGEVAQYLDLSNYLPEDDPQINAGAAYMASLFPNFGTSPLEVFSEINTDLLAKRGYAVNETAFTAAITNLAKVYPCELYDLLFVQASEPISSSGRIFTFSLARPSIETTEFAYDAFSQCEYSVTIYFDGDSPVSFLPFPEPLIDSYAPSYGFTH